MWVRCACALALLCALGTVGSEKRAEMAPVPFVLGSRYGRSPPRHLAPRNDRFFMGSRYGKRSMTLSSQDVMTSLTDRNTALSTLVDRQPAMTSPVDRNPAQTFDRQSALTSLLDRQPSLTFSGPDTLTSPAQRQSPSLLWQALLSAGSHRSSEDEP